jgi:hypothetical protein
LRDAGKGGIDFTVSIGFEHLDGDAEARRGARLKSKTLCGAGVRGVWTS